MIERNQVKNIFLSLFGLFVLRRTLIGLLPIEQILEVKITTIACAPSRSRLFLAWGSCFETKFFSRRYAFLSFSVFLGLSSFFLSRV